jgi:hypothetical protein
MISLRRITLFQVLIFLGFTLPTGYRNLFKSGSDSNGLLLFCIIAIFFFILIKRYIRVNNLILKKASIWFFLFYLILFFHSVSALILNDNFSFIRAYLSVIITFPIIFSAIILWDAINTVDEVQFDYSIKALFYLMIITGYVGALTFSSESGAGKGLIFFSEPSHFALVFTSLFAYFAITVKKVCRIFAFIFAIILGFLIQNLTFFIGIFLTALLFLNLKKLVVLLSILVIGLLFYDQNSKIFLYYIDRFSFIYGVEEANNLTALSYLQGWQFILESIENYFPFGLGFQQLGSVDLFSTATVKLEFMGYSLNRNDGSFLASKIISEFGILGMVLISSYVYFLIVKVNFLRKKIMDHSIYFLSSKTIFFTVIYIFFSLTLFVRGSGYFTTATFFFLICLIYFCCVTLKKIPS